MTLKEKLSGVIAEEFINEIMMAALALMLLLSGVNYFGMQWSWLEGMQATTPGMSNNAISAEAVQMISALTSTFPFNYIFVEYAFWNTIIIASCLTVLGILLKIFTIKTKGKFIIELGNELVIPAVVGFIGIIILQLWTAFNIKGYLILNKLSTPALATGIYVWNEYGQIFLIGASVLVIGAILKLLGEKNEWKVVELIGDTMFGGAFILIVYYIILRMLALDVIMQSTAGTMLSIFLISNKFSTFTLIACVFIFAFGKSLKTYGVKTLKHEKRMMQIDELRVKYALMKEKYGARPATAVPPHPKELHVHEHHLRQQAQHPAYSTPGHPVHKYVDPAGKYSHYSKK